MLNIDELTKEREEAFDIWFERWWAREDLEHQIKVSNCKGYAGCTLVLANCNDYEQRKMSRDRFLLKLQGKLPGFEVEFRYRTNWVTKKDYLYGISIRWS